ncbi:uncharacterized protein LOC108626769 isoform X2 [Ceratina calcarata]|uniref:Uncharacterized protein LOC108626769 isoform X2 n=1 Tax=Ceratina calcarata TaxID=156304 RepID=A0AAJ7N8N6_9HYME|nr:uncharacterized protein LOC108626769 isoform X2 [Ceratina calcarata]
MDRRGAFFISIACILIALAVASEPGTGRNGVSRSSQEASLPATRVGANATGSEVDDGSRGQQERVEPSENVQTEEDYEGGDEYEDELKAVAESHEAMSKDDTRNSNASTASSTGVRDGTSVGTQNFDSREVITANSSDEDVASNEAITDELVDKYDQEVAELVKYKKERSHGESNGRTKTKRVPTVKKELSTQKEILIGSNETQVPKKNLIPPEDPVNRLGEETEAIRRRNAENGPVGLEDPAYSEEGEIVENNRNSEERPKKLDKRQETVLKDLKSYLLTEYATEEEQREKLRELEAQEDVLAKNLLKLLVNLAENPNRWERVQKLLVNAENELKLSRNGLDPGKRSYEPASTLFPSTTEFSKDSRKSRKKLKKKKKAKHRFTTTTLTPVPATPPLLTTTETPWQTTPVQRLIVPLWWWGRDSPEGTEKAAGYSVTQNRRSLPSIRELIEQNKSRPFSDDRKPILPDEVGELGNQRLPRFGKIGTREPGHVQPHREFANAYDGLGDPERMSDYDVEEAYHSLRYPQSRDYLRRRDEEYPIDFNVQADRFRQEYEPSRDYELSRSWPDLSYRYDSPWRTEERLLPIDWPWRQSSDEGKYWPQRGYLPVEKNYWSNNEEDAEQEEARKMWQQQRVQYWKDKSNWSAERGSKAPTWQQGERPVKLYDREQASGNWDKGKNRSELNKSSTKPENKEKVVLPQITMKTWNSLTSDPATWPHKLPGAKPWPKDENGKSYNPNADLVKKLGLDKQNNGRSKEQSEKASDERKSKDEKQSRVFASKESVKEEELPLAETSKYKSNDDRSNFSDYKTRESKPWSIVSEPKGSKEWKTESMQGDDASAWRRKYEGKNPWTNEEAALPKIQSVGAWVMAADQSTWKPYHIKPMDSTDETVSRRWSKPIDRSNTDGKWLSKGSWPEKVNDSWMDQSDTGLWPEKTEFWPEKSNKPGSWFPKTKSGNSNWKAKEGWLPKPESSSWISKEDSSWATRIGPWSTKSNESWTSKDEAAKDSWSVKMKEDEGDSWSRKSNDQGGWSSKGNDLSPWQQKINDEWTYGKASSTGAWPAKWKQFAYHRVTAMPISKPGTTADAAASKPKNNAFVAVSAVSSPKYTGTEWRKNDEDARNENGRVDEQERGVNQFQVGLERPIYAWKKDPGTLRDAAAKSNGSDPLENQLEALRQIDFWSYKENEAEKRLTSTSATMETTSVPSNSTSPTAHRRGILPAGNDSGVLENRRTISMK